MNDVWKNTGPGAAIEKGGGNLGGETAPDVGEYGPLNAEGMLKQSAMLHRIAHTSLFRSSRVY